MEDTTLQHTSDLHDATLSLPRLSRSLATKHLSDCAGQPPGSLLHLLLARKAEARTEPDLALAEAVLASVGSEDGRRREDDEVADETVKERLRESGRREGGVVRRLVLEGR